MYYLERRGSASAAWERLDGPLLLAQAQRRLDMALKWVAARQGTEEYRIVEAA